MSNRNLSASRTFKLKWNYLKTEMFPDQRTCIFYLCMVTRHNLKTMKGNTELTSITNLSLNISNLLCDRNVLCKIMPSVHNWGEFNFTQLYLEHIKMNSLIDIITYIFKYGTVWNRCHRNSMKFKSRTTCISEKYRNCLLPNAVCGIFVRCESVCLSKHASCRIPTQN
jgi:hypothetical protein